MMLSRTSLYPRSSDDREIRECGTCTLLSWHFPKSDHFTGCDSYIFHTVAASWAFIELAAMASAQRHASVEPYCVLCREPLVALPGRAWTFLFGGRSPEANWRLHVLGCMWASDL